MCPDEGVVVDPGARALKMNPRNPNIPATIVKQLRAPQQRWQQH